MVKSKVSVGTSTVAGLLTALAAFGAAVAAYKQGDRSEATLGTIAGSTVGVVSLVATLAGRFAQAHKIATPALELDETTADIIAGHVTETVDKRLDEQFAPQQYDQHDPVEKTEEADKAVYFDQRDADGYAPEPDTVSCAAVRSMTEAVPNAQHVVTRAEWNARSPRPTTPQGPPREAFVHHSDDPDGDIYDTLEKQKAKVRQIQAFHMGPERGWSDIAYHYVVFQTTPKVGARAFAGRSVGATPAAQLGHNTETLAICVVGNGDVEPLDRNTRFVIEKLIERHPSVRKVGGHRDVVSTDCPGDKFYAAIPRIADAVNLPHF